jgi:hypothetical protein
LIKFSYSQLNGLLRLRVLSALLSYSEMKINEDFYFKAIMNLNFLMWI